MAKHSPGIGGAHDPLVAKGIAGSYASVSQSDRPVMG